MLIKKISSFFNPEQFQGWSKNRSYFEGWYYKIVNKDETKAFAFIPGIAIDENGEKHAFVQVLDGKNKSSKYFKYHGDMFIPRSGSLDVSIDKSRFTEKDLTLDLPDFHGHLTFSKNVPWPKPFYSPGIMGPYAFIPFMECYHGIVSMDHEITGTLKIRDELINFDGGRGYIEKDWGRSFPSAYVWIQSNHFTNAGISLKASVAKIPWINNAFVGFIAGLWHNGILYRFTTYNRTKLTKCTIDRESVSIVMENKNFQLAIEAQRDHATELASPILGLMDGRIEESMSSIIEVELIDKKSRSIIFQDKGRNTGLEVAGKIEEITT